MVGWGGSGCVLGDGRLQCFTPLSYVIVCKTQPHSSYSTKCSTCISSSSHSLDVPGPSWWTPPPSGGRRHSRQWREESRPAKRIRGTQTILSAASWDTLLYVHHHSATATQCIATSSPPVWGVTYTKAPQLNLWSVLLLWHKRASACLCLSTSQTIL